MRIDWHVHINDPKYMGPPWWQHPVPMSLENALEAPAAECVLKSVGEDHFLLPPTRHPWCR
jgi:hypothetical protein